MTPTHAMTLDGQMKMAITDSFFPIEKAVQRGLEILDGKENFAYSIWRLSPGLKVGQEPDGWPFSYIQSAGSADAMTVEIRVSAPNDEHSEQFVVGRPVDSSAELSLVTIPWGGRSQDVYSNEVFDADEAGAIYWHYYNTDTVPEQYALRKLEI